MRGWGGRFSRRSRSGLIRQSEGRQEDKIEEGEAALTTLRAVGITREVRWDTALDVAYPVPPALTHSGQQR